MLHVNVSGTGKDIVLIHGITDNSATWNILLRKLSGVRAHAVDLPGHGQSYLPKKPMTIGETVAELVGYFEKAKLERPVVIGWSLGGGLALALAGRYPEKVGNLVLVSPACLSFPFPKVLSPLRNPWTARMMWVPSFYRPWARYQLRGCYHRGFHIPDEAVDNYFRPWRKWGRASYLSALLRTFDLADVNDALDKVKQKAIVVHGETDRLIPIEIGRQLAKRLKRAELRELKECGHEPQIEKPDEVVKAIMDALRD
jgi:pimeloyl-ACP methyl ester carboxylesterase